VGYSRQIFIPRSGSASAVCAGTLTDTDRINTAAGLAPGSNKAAPQAFFGWYGQAAYHVWKSGDLDVAPFLRYERYNTQQAVDEGYTSDINNDETVTTAGVNVKLHPQVVLKADFQRYQTDSRKDRINLGVVICSDLPVKYQQARP